MAHPIHSDPERRPPGSEDDGLRSRTEWIWSRASSAYYFANEYNTASIKMHEALGFLPVARFAEVHGATPDDGRSELILFEASR